MASNREQNSFGCWRARHKGDEGKRSAPQPVPFVLPCARQKKEAFLGRPAVARVHDKHETIARSVNNAANWEFEHVWGVAPRESKEPESLLRVARRGGLGKWTCPLDDIDS